MVSRYVIQLYSSPLLEPTLGFPPGKAIEIDCIRALFVLDRLSSVGRLQASKVNPSR